MPKQGKAPVVPASGQLGALGVERIHQYAGQEQVDLAVVVDIPGSWFGAGAGGGLARQREEGEVLGAGCRVCRGPRVQEGSHEGDAACACSGIGGADAALRRSEAALVTCEIDFLVPPVTSVFTFVSRK